MGDDAVEERTRVVGGASQTVGIDEVGSRHHKAAAEPGSQVGRYVVGERLGVGGMGEVYAAEDPELDRRVALKFVRVGKADRAEGRSRLLREAQALAQLNHPNVVTIYDAGTYGDGQDPLVYIAMEYVEGVTLKRWLEDERPWPEVLDVLLRAGRGLAAAHRAGLVHRDFKPSNVMLEHGTGRVRVLDFGLALASGPTSVDPLDTVTPSLESSDASLQSPLTQTGAVLGTPGFMAPEQFAHHSLDARTDQFSFCVTTYRALYGVRPFAGDGFEEIRRNVMKGRMLNPPQGSAVPAKVFALLSRGLSRRPGDRWDDIDVLLAGLERQLPRVALSRWVAPAVLVGTVAVVGGLAWAYSGEPRCEGAAQKLDGVWDDARRGEMRSAFEATELAYAEHSLEAAQTGLDAFAEEWVSMRTEVCRAQAEGMDVSIACLDRRLVVAAALIDVFVAADSKVVEHAAQSVAGLRPLSECDAAEGGRRVEAPPAAVAETVAQMQAELARIGALALSGKYQDAAEPAAALLERAKEVGYQPTLGESAAQLGQLYERLGRGLDATEAYSTARQAAAASNDPRVEVLALSGLASVHGVQLGELDTALDLGRHAKAALERAGSPADLAMRIEISIGNAYYSSGDAATAIAHHRRAIVLADSLDDPGARGMAARNNLAGALASMGEYDEAHRVVTDAMGAVRRELGPDHPVLAKLYDNRGSFNVAIERYDDASRDYNAALDIYERTLGPDHFDIGRVLSNIGVVQMKLGDVEGSLASQKRGHAIKKAALDPGHPSLAMSSNNVAEALRILGRPAEALPHLEEAVRLWENGLGRDAPELIYALSGYVDVYLDLREPQRCMPYARRGLEIAARSKKFPAGVAEFRFAAARCLWANGEEADAVALARRAREALAATQAAAQSEIAEVDAWLAKRE